MRAVDAVDLGLELAPKKVIRWLFAAAVVAGLLSPQAAQAVQGAFVWYVEQRAAAMQETFDDALRQLTPPPVVRQPGPAAF